VVVSSVGRGLLWAGGGAVAGWAAFAGVAGRVASWLHGVTPKDPATHLGTLLVLSAAAAAAAYVPARRAAAVDPAITLRQE
jgi:hypothetical protein